MSKTKKTTAYLRGKGYTVEEMWECDFELFCQQHPQSYALGWEMRPAFYRKHRKGVKVNENRIWMGLGTGHYLVWWK